MKLFDSINAVKNIFHSILNVVVISFPFVKAIFQKKARILFFKRFQPKRTFMPKTTTKLLHLHQREREKK